MTGKWSPHCLPNGVWEVLEVTETSYRTIVRSVTREQAKAIAEEHNKLFADNELQYVATVLGSDPYDERSGPFYSAVELRNLDALQPGDKLYVRRGID